MGEERCAWLESIAAHALGALDPAERRALERHLAAGCAACERERQRAERDVAALAESPGPVAPRPRTRDRLVRATRRRNRGAPSTGE